MSEESDKPRKADVDPDALKRGYEPDNVGVRGLGIFLILFCVGAVLIQVVAWLLLKFYMGETRESAAPKSAVVRLDRAIEPSLQPSPLHDTTPAQDLARLREGENRIFAHMGWEIDAESGEARIPRQIVAMLRARRPTPTTGPVLNAYEIPYVAATKPTGVTPVPSPQTTTPPPPYLLPQPEGIKP